MTLADRKRVAEVMLAIVKAEFLHAWALTPKLQRGLRHLAAQAQQMGLQPEDVLTENGRDAFTTIARAIFHTAEPKEALPKSLRAEWATVLRLAA